MKSSQRDLAWEGCANVRDLGGLPTLDGGQTCWQRVIRSDLLGRLSDSGLRAMLDYGVRTVIDLRGAQEAQADPSIGSILLADDASLDYQNLPIEQYYPHVSALIAKAKSRAEVYCIVLDHYAPAVATIMRAMIAAQPGGVVLHCQSGKDRTGLIAALLLGLADVAPALIAEDYALSQLRLAPPAEQQLAAAAGSFWNRPTATIDMMHTTLAHLERSYGGSRDYLRAAGLSAAELEQLRRCLR